MKALVNSANFNNPINLPVNRTAGEVILMVVKYALVQALSLTEIYDLFGLINCLFKVAVSPSTRYLTKIN